MEPAQKKSATCLSGMLPSTFTTSGGSWYAAKVSPPRSRSSQPVLNQSADSSSDEK